MRAFLPAALLSLALVLGPASAGGDTGSMLRAGLGAYFSGRFDESAVELKRFLLVSAKGGDRQLGAVTAYVLGRVFHELGLRGLALHYLGEAEHSGGDEERRFAQRELARIYFRAAEYAAVVEVFRRLRPEEREGEIAYLAGISAAMQSRWGEAEGILGRIKPGDPVQGHALYARAQARAAAEDFSGALADLEAVAAIPEERGRGLGDQARILAGKLLYLEGRNAEARGSFAAVKPQGVFGLEAVRGLLLTGAGPEAASEIGTVAVRPQAAAILLLVRAAAAEERDDAPGATEIRQQLRKVVERRLKGLEGLSSSDGPSRTALERDLDRFESLLRRRRWATGCVEERRLLPPKIAASLSSDPPSEMDAFRPDNSVFYAAWDQARVSPWLRGLIEILARTDTLDHDLRLDSARKPFWAFWRSGSDELPRLALLVIRTANLRQLFEDHRQTFRSLGVESLRAAKSESIEQAVASLGRLYWAGDEKAPEDLSNIEKALDYKRTDMLRLIESVPERSTDPVISLLGNYVDLLADLRERLGKVRKPSPLDDSTRQETLDSLRSSNAALRVEVAREIHQAIGPTVRREMAFFTRVGADNEGSLSKLYARTGTAAERGRRP